jgi:hypothetical protein
MIPAAEKTCWNLMTPAGVTTMVEAKKLSVNSRGRWCGEKLISFLASVSPKQYETGGEAL